MSVHCSVALSPQTSSNSPSYSCFSSKSCPCPSEKNCVKTGPGRRHSKCKEPEVRVCLTYLKKSKEVSPRAGWGGKMTPWPKLRSEQESGDYAKSLIACDEAFRFYSAWGDKSLKSLNTGSEMLYLILKKVHSGNNRKLDWGSKRSRETTLESSEIIQVQSDGGRNRRGNRGSG